jgi:hypothetical protein
MLEGEDTCDPIIKVSCLGTDKKTKDKKDITSDESVKFNEHLFLEYSNLNKD